MKDKKQTILLAGGILITAVLVIVAIVTALRLQQLSSVAPTAPESKPRAVTEQKIEKIETQDDDGSIGGGNCGGSPCKNELIIYPGTGDGDFKKVKKLEWEMHDHHEGLRVLLKIRGKNNKFETFGGRIDIGGGPGGTQLCGRDPVRDRKHPPGTEGDDSCFRLYTQNINSEIDAVRFEFSCVDPNCKPKGYHVHIKKITWTVEVEGQPTATIPPSPTTVQPPTNACTTTFTVAAEATPTEVEPTPTEPEEPPTATATLKPTATSTPGPTATATPTKVLTTTLTATPTTIAAASPTPGPELPEAGVSLPTIAIGLGSLLLIALGLLFAL